MSNSMIIGIHGLLNKVKAETLATWWSQAIEEGLKRNAGRMGPLPFRLAYWADVRNPTPVPLSEEDEKYGPAPGTGALERYTGSALMKARAKAHEWFGKPADWVKDLGTWDNTERLIGVSVEDLSAYYREAATRQQIRERLVRTLQNNADKRILILSHSMGTIVAYDVLRELDHSETTTVEHFVTMGSPLGLPLVSRNIREEFIEQRTPTRVSNWTNLADPGDKVALDFNLADEFGPNARGVTPRDVLIRNGFVSATGKENRHKSYGYLRAPEVCDIVSAFLSSSP